MHTVTVNTELPADAALVWRGVCTPAAFEHVAAPLIRYPAAGAIDRPWRRDDVVEGWTFLFGIVPFSKHHLRIADLDDDARRLTSAEHGGVIRTWNHVIEVEPVAPDRCRYTDRIDIDAGPLTLLVATYAHLFYRHRQRRWTRLARLLRLYEEAGADTG